MCHLYEICNALFDIVSVTRTHELTSYSSAIDGRVTVVVRLMSYTVRSFPSLLGSRRAWSQGWRPLARSVFAVGREVDNVPVYNCGSGQLHRSCTVQMLRCRFSSCVTSIGSVRCAAGR